MVDGVVDGVMDGGVMDEVSTFVANHLSVCI